MNRCHPSHSHSPNRTKRPAGTVMNERKKSESVGHPGPRKGPKPCPTRRAATIPSHPTSAVVRMSSPPVSDPHPHSAYGADAAARGRGDPVHACRVGEMRIGAGLSTDPDPATATAHAVEKARSGLG